METFFKEVGEITDERFAAAQEITAEDLAVKNSVRTLVAGFPATQVTINLPTDDELIKIQKNILDTNARMNSFRAELLQKGVAPVAVLPLALFKQLLKEFQIIDLGILSSNGEASSPLSRKKFTNHLVLANQAKISLGSIIAVSSFLLIPILSIWFTSVTAILTSMLVVGFTALTILYFKPVKQKELVKLLWPNYITGTGEPYVPVTFPTPPQEVQDILNKLGSISYSVGIAAAPEAITVNWKQIVKKQKAEEVEAWREKIRAKKLAAMNDPIGYVVNGNVVAVLFQFGHFKKEKELIGHVKNMSNLEFFGFI